MHEAYCTDAREIRIGSLESIAPNSMGELSPAAFFEAASPLRSQARRGILVSRVNAAW